jgi:uncharacterized protein YccT (UPF0319 family)
MKKMKKSLFTLALALPMAGFMITGCQQSDSKVDKARDKLQDAGEQVVVANQELNRTLNDSIKLFKMESGELIISYENSIAELKTRLENEKEENKIILEKKLALLEKKSKDLKTRLEEYKEEDRDKWTSFKNEFNHDMEELGEAFKDLAADNVK